ncbi:ABC transporter permease [Roseibium aggregatum]|uniref:ABC transporter permease n=1 Tax=Roseibium aggregatum TaxID=187304 RepID=A0A926S4Z0_9HYPH|nr:ABC transporter permease [Roseibium aggregatum]MBD1545605.1 ABC transporter permease [Roseibium aggregatum]
MPDPVSDKSSRRKIFAIRQPVSRFQIIVSAIGIWVVFFGIWLLATETGAVNQLLVPAPQKVLVTIYELFVERGFASDVGISIGRVIVAFLAASLVAIPLGVVMGAFPAAEAIFNPFVSAWRYLPAPSFIPVLLMWFGTGEAPKLALLFIGVVFFLITLVMDHTKNVRNELIETALTLGAGRGTIVRSVILPAVLPNIVVAMRQMLAVTWTYLVIAEIVASTTGIGAMMMRARRFLHTDEIMAGIIVIGVLGLTFDLLFDRLHRWLFPYLQEKR